MKKPHVVYFGLALVSAAVISFEIISTRISSVIFVYNYAFIILSLAVLGLGTGGIFSYYKIHINISTGIRKLISLFIFLSGLTIALFISAVIVLNITNPFIYFFLLFLPFFFAGIIYSLLFKYFAANSFKLYAADLIGAALGSALSIAAFSFFNAANALLFLSLILFTTALIFFYDKETGKRLPVYSAVILIPLTLLIIFGRSDFLGKVPVGHFPEKDFYYVYPDAEQKSNIIDSRWSIYGRSDLVEYNDQNFVKQLFIDGAAGTQMYRFGGDPQNISSVLYNLLIRNSSAVPLTFLRDFEKDKMLVIGPGGGKEVLTGLVAGIKDITGVEINPDFVNIVKDHKNFNGGIYTDFPNIHIRVKEGRHYIKQINQLYDLIVMVLPSTEQLQNIDNFAMSENYLLTVEAIKDYLKILTSEGQMIFTVHNRWELIRLIVTALTAFKDNGISYEDALNHFIIIGQDYEPTIVIKKRAFSEAEISLIKNYDKRNPAGIPHVTYLPYNWNVLKTSIENRLLKTVKQNKISLEQYIEKDKFDISPVYDDSPYFYKVNRGVPQDYLWLLNGVGVFGLSVILIPYLRIKRKLKKAELQLLKTPLTVFICIGLGFMLLEVSFFQKLVLYLGSPTISLSVLLGSLLMGMGTGSYFGKNIFGNNLISRIKYVTLAITLSGIIIFILYPFILNQLLVYSQLFRSIVTFFMILPFGFLLGIPFPSAVLLLKEADMENYIPWMYGINGIMSVFGSVSAVILSMLLGFTPAFFAGLSFYLLIYLIMVIFFKSRPKTV